MVFETDSAPEFLQQEFHRRVRMNPKYSLRAYARSLGLSSGALSEILNQRRPLSLKAASKIAKSLGLNQKESKRLYELVETDKRKSLNLPETPQDQIDNADRKQLDVDTFHLISEWYHFAVLNLVDCLGFRWQAAHIAKRLGISLTQAQMAMRLLTRLGLVKKRNGRIICAKDYVLSPSGAPSAAIRNFHRQMLVKATEALEFQSVDDREVSGVGFALDPKLLPQLKHEISEFQDQLIAKYSIGKRQEVYFFETALFRLTQGGSDENK